MHKHILVLEMKIVTVLTTLCLLEAGNKKQEEA